MSKQSLCETMSLNHKLIPVNICFDTHLGKHLYNCFRSVALLVCKTSHTGNAARTLTECRQHGDYREKVRAIGSIHCKCLEWCTLNCYRPLVAVKLRKARSGIHQYIHNRKVCLK